MLQHFLEECGLTQAALAEHLEWTTTRVNQIVKGKRAITPETALCLADVFGNSPQFWLHGQLNWELWHALQEHVQRPKLDFSEADKVIDPSKLASHVRMAESRDAELDFFSRFHQLDLPFYKGHMTSPEPELTATDESS